MNTETVAEHPKSQESNSELTSVQLQFELGQPVTVVVDLPKETCNQIRQTLFPQKDETDLKIILNQEEHIHSEKLTEADAKQYAYLVESHYERVYTYFYAIFRNSMDAEDHTQETFLRLFKNIHSLKTPELHQNWLMRTARNLRIHTFRKKNNSDEQLQDDRDDMYPNPQPGIEQQIISKSEDEMFRNMFIKLLYELPDDSITMVWLFYFQGIKQQTIANIFKVDVGVIKSRFFRIREKIADIYLLSSSPVLLNSK